MKALVQTTRRPDITIYRNGRIDISAHVVALLKINQGDVVNVVRDDEGEIYLCVSFRVPLYGRFSGRCVFTNRKGHHMRTYSKSICNELFQLMHAPESMRIAHIAIGEMHCIDGLSILTLILKRETT